MSSGRMVFVAACLAVFMASVEATIVATAIPTIVGDLGGLRLFTWVFGIYFLTQAVGIPIYGRLADIYGRKKLLVVAVTLFLAGSILSGFAHNMIALIVFRGLQGLGAGGVQPMASTIVGDIYTGKERARAQGYLSSVWGISAVAGPLLGAVIVEHFGWPVIFWVNVPFGILCVATVLRFFNERIERQPHRIDYAGSLLLAAGTGTLMFVLIMAGNLPGVSMIVLAVLAFALIATLIAHELHAAEPMMPLRLLRIRVIAVANSSNFAMGALAMGVTAFLPTYVQGAMGLSPIEAGATLGVMSASWTVGALFGSRLLAKATYRATALTGCVFLIAGSAFLIALQLGSGIWWAVAGATCLGLGFGYTNLVFIVTTQASVGWEQRGAATASNLFMRQLGQAIGTAAFGAVFNLGLYARVPEAGDVVTRMMQPIERAQMAVFDVQRYAAAIAGSLHVIYIIVGILAVIVFGLTLALPGNMRPGDAPLSHPELVEGGRTRW
jgi:EmrB/QacA subfamily drug resistance transporter